MLQTKLLAVRSMVLAHLWLSATIDISDSFGRAKIVRHLAATAMVLALGDSCLFLTAAYSLQLAAAKTGLNLYYVHH